jgi:hypothetical protein
MRLHGMIDQAPHVIQIVAERIRPTVRTPFGTYQFHRLDPALIGGYAVRIETPVTSTSPPLPKLYSTRCIYRPGAAGGCDISPS